MQTDHVGGPVVAPPSDDDDDGYISPDFNLPSESEDEELEDIPAVKRSKYLHQGNNTGSPSLRTLNETVKSVDEDEELALSLLRRRRYVVFLFCFWSEDFCAFLPDNSMC